MPSRFQPLTEHLHGRSEPVVTLSFTLIETLVGPLPKSARDYDAYWSETATHTITHAWLRAGFVRQGVNRAAGTLKLRRAPIEAARLRARHRVGP
jgi:hypothetical protein